MITTATTARPSTHRALSLALALSIACLTAAQAKDANIAISAAQIKALGVEVQKPVAVASSASAPWSARVIPAPDAEWVVATHREGVVLRIAVSEGQVVEAGTVLAEISSPEAPQLGAGLQAAESALRLARSEAERDRQLHAEGIIAARRLQGSEQAESRAKAELDALQTQLKLMGLSAQDARDGRLRVRAPASGTVLERRITVGQPVAASEVLFRIADTRKLWLELQVPVAAAARFSPGQVLQMDKAEARVRAIGSQASADTQTVSVRSELISGTAQLRPGQWVTLQSAGQTAGAQNWQLPSAAISREGDQAYVFARRPEGFAAVAVTVLASDAQTATVSGALDADTLIAVNRSVALKGVWLGHGGE